MDASIAQLKKEMRRRIEAQRAALSETERQVRSAAICEQAIRYFWDGRDAGKAGPMADHPALTVLAYFPFRSEADISPVIEYCWDRSIRLAAPKVDKASGNLSLHWVRGYEDLALGAWGIREPGERAALLENASEIDLILVPGMAFDRAGRRLGYGGGFYDRLLASLGGQGSKTPVKASLIYQFQLVDEVPAEQHDIRVDTLISENGVIAANGKNP
ncbi:5-formyltetrahydrofolate cyclo-ligase [Ferviditalea candida]|uniref:5-formyltetrahydrofolate cyclo-ligase n=1 Tax=Ferviditalea candida TaxID=3108399 RepID=A0ABU5ZEI3_9BACL|nr:5-formyltetrahydrofolate cyclo-ligase [Paenibacillaceae bacterium T2]